MRVLLVKPKYYSKYPPLGLLKLSSYHKIMGNSVHYQEGKAGAPWYPDEIYITSLFTYAWKSVHETVNFYKELYPYAQIKLGGIYATLFPEHAAESGAEVYPGLFTEAEDLLPDYALFPDWKASIIFSTRGCVNNCPFCAVPMIEPNFTTKYSIKHLIYEGHNKVILWDNNLLASPNWFEVLNEIKELDLIVDFNQGLDARLITSEKAKFISSMKTQIVRTAFDNRSEKRVKRGIRLLLNSGIRARKILVYLLYNFEKDTPEDLLFRLQEMMKLGVVSYPMRYQPVQGAHALKKDSYVSPTWSPELLEMVADARRVLGSHGAFPPYEGLKKKFLSAKSLEEALALRPTQNNSNQTKTL
jgi:hypothetical protein